MGAMRFPTLDGRIDEAKAQAIIDECFNQGVNYFDTAYIYHRGQSERFLSKALAKYPRDRYYLADKFNLQANPDYRAQFEEQRSRLNADVIDFYMLHSVQDPAIPTMLSCGCIQYFDQCKAEGKIKYFGFSFHGSPEGMRAMLKAYAWDFVQIQLNYYDWQYGDAKTLYELVDEAGIPVMVMEPLHGGKLATLTPPACEILTEALPDASIASWGMRWLMGLPRVAVVLSGMSDIAQAKDNIETFTRYLPLDQGEKEALYAACALYRPAVSVACTGCHYCCPHCPMGLDIPRMLAVYNEIKLDSNWRITFLEALPKDKQPIHCIGCGACVHHCPQNLDIPTYIKALAEIAGGV